MCILQVYVVWRLPELKTPKGKFRIVGIDKFEIPVRGFYSW